MQFGRRYESGLSLALRSGFAQMETGWTRALLCDARATRLLAQAQTVNAPPASR